MKLASHEPYEE